MPKNIVICCDGTGNEFGDRNTNVVKLYSTLDLSDPSRQIAFYHPGLGTMGASNAPTRLMRWWTKVKGLAFGYGLTTDIGSAYRFLMENYEEGDRIYLFGFSRGAYTARALSGMLHMLGLLRRGNEVLIPYATDILKKPTAKTFGIARNFKETLCRECKPYFMGVWDTVSSVGWIYDPVHIPYTAKNPDLSVGRHAISIDERRCFFRQNMWAPSQPGDIKQIWFAGVHSDVGGGYGDTQSGLSEIALEWMLIEARQFGLLTVDEKIDAVLRKTERNSGPDASADMHNSLTDGAWLALEVIPRRAWDTTCEPPRSRWRIPLAARRTLPKDAIIHESVLRRKELRSDYNPPNVPEKPAAVEPWVEWRKSKSRAAGM